MENFQRAPSSWANIMHHKISPPRAKGGDECHYVKTESFHIALDWSLPWSTLRPLGNVGMGISTYSQF